MNQEELCYPCWRRRRRRRTQSIGPHFDSGPLQPPSPQFYYHVVDMDGKTVFTRRKKSDLIKTYFQYCIELKGTNRTNRIPRYLQLVQKQQNVIHVVAQCFYKCLYSFVPALIKKLSIKI